MCPICASGAISRGYTLHDDRYGYPGEFAQWGCAACGHRWLAWSPEDAELATMYSQYYTRADRSVEELAAVEPEGELAAWWRGRRSSAARWVPPGTRVLDIGCGFGESLAYHASRGCEVHGVETDRNIARVAERYGFDVAIGPFEPARYAAHSFHYVTLDQVLEHARDPVEMLRGVRQVLAPEGRVVVTTPNASGIGARLFGDRWIHWHAPYHLHGFTRASLAIACERAGLAVEDERTITSSEWMSYQWIHLATAPAVGEPSAFWAPMRNRGRRWTIRGLRAVHRSGIDHLLTRILDTAGIGDNLIAVLRPAPEEHQR